MQPSMNTTREYHLSQAKDTARVWDIIIIGGGSTGAGIALDAAARGYQVLLLEGHDFGKGTSSRSTKLIHGGVRYLQQMQFGMVRDSLRERSLLMLNAPHHVHELEFIIPCRSYWERAYYGTGLKLYDALAKNSRMRKSHQVSRSDLYQNMPALAKKFAGGVAYSDAQFDDTRLLIEILLTAVDEGATVLNHAPVISLLKDDRGKIAGVAFREEESGTEHEALARCVINATGPFSDVVRRLEDSSCDAMLSASQGVHLVLPKSFFPSSKALIVPKTSDGRVLFIIPWLDHVVVGTTDTSINEATFEPKPYADELQFLLDTVGEYCETKPKLYECTSVFTGIRPLVRSKHTSSTKRLSRDHTIEISEAGLITIAGGKWTTYRHMAEDCVDQAAKSTGLSFLASRTTAIPLNKTVLRKKKIEQTSVDDVKLDTMLNITRQQILDGVRLEFARTIEDLLARRTRALFLNTAAAKRIAPLVAEMLAAELSRDEDWKSQQLAEFNELAATYDPNSF